MNDRHHASTRLVCCLLVGLLLAVPACTQKPVNHPVDVARILADYKAPTYYDEKFEPVPAAELAGFQIPPAEPYRLGVGDAAAIRVFSARPLSGYGATTGVEARVKEDGYFHIPLVGRVQAKDKTALELEALLTEQFQKDFVKDAIVSVEVTRFGARRFFVVGEVGNPGTLPVNGRTTLLEALIASGGTNLETADLEEAFIIRKQKPLPFSVRDIVMRGHPIGRLVLQEYDIVFVPHVKERTDYVYIFGEVGSPSRLPMEHEGRRGTVGSLTLASAIAQAGGLSGGRADINDVRIYRGGWQHPKMFRLGVHEVYQYGEEIQLRPGDRIAVGMSGTANFSETLGPTLSLLGATTSALSLAVSAAALASN